MDVGVFLFWVLYRICPTTQPQSPFAPHWPKVTVSQATWGSHFTPSSCSANLQASWRVPLLLQLPTSSQAWRTSMLPLLAPHWTSWGSPSPLEAGKGHQPPDGLCLLCLASWPGLKCYLFLLGLSCSLLLFDIPFSSQFVKWLLWSPLFLVFSGLVACFS